jgi:PAS domain S-box-containing protein
MFPARSQLALPLRVGERNLGAVLIAFNEPHTFTDEEIARAAQAVDLAVPALENARLFHHVQQSRRDWEATFDAMPDLITILDHEFRITRTNKAMADKLGVAPTQAVGMICYDCVHGTQQPPPSCPHVRLLADGQEHSAEVHEDRLGGDFFVSVSPIHDANGHLLGAVHVARDITERKRAEEELG